MSVGNILLLLLCGYKWFPTSKAHAILKGQQNLSLALTHAYVRCIQAYTFAHFRLHIVCKIAIWRNYM